MLFPEKVTPVGKKIDDKNSIIVLNCFSDVNGNILKT